MFLRKLLGLRSKPQLSRLSSSELLKLATQQKREGDLDSAVVSIRRAHDRARSEGVTLSASAYLKLPQYLLVAGRNDRAWSELNKMLQEGLTGNTPHSEMLFVEHSQIYGQMSKQRKKEGDKVESAVYSAVSTICWQVAMRTQKRLEDRNVDFEVTQNQLKKLINELDDDIQEAFIEEVVNALKMQGKARPADLLKDLKRVVGAGG